MTWRALLVAGACALGIGCTESPPSVGARRAEILGGSVALADPAVGLLEFSTGRFGTGTLIAPNLVLTAAHVVGGNIQAFYTGAGIPSPMLDNTVSSPTMVRHELASKLTHPAYQCTMAGTCDALGGFDLDVGLVQLAEPIVDLTPLPLDTTVPAIGNPCRTVGFGIYLPEGGDNADMATVKQKRQADVKVIDLDDVYVLVDWVTGAADHGDSGGPLFCGGKLVATTTMHTDGELAKHRQEYDTRVDRALQWIESTVAALGPPQDLGVADLTAPAPTGSGGCRTAGGDAGLPGVAFVALLGLLRRRRRATS